MLQQTQTARVTVLLPLFLKKFPSINVLAAASPGEVLMAWKGMGYNNRAIRLHALAKKVVADHRGKIPSSVDLLLSLPGIGPYTAHAVACFAFGKQVPVVDVNIHRILSRWFKKDLSMAAAWRVAEELLPDTKAYDWNQAMMDLGATVCTASSPMCIICPARSFCKSAFAPKTVQKERSKKNEPSRKGVPNRIYRGKIVEYLRTHPGYGRAKKIAETVFPKFTSLENVWFFSLLTDLEKDRLITVKKSGKTSLDWKVQLID